MAANETTDPNDLMTPSDSVRVLSDNGRLPAMRTVSGRRLFKRGDVDRLAAQRAAHAEDGAKAASRAP
jgi:hypothetical protein